MFPDYVFIIAIPVALLGVIGLVLLSGTLTPARRRLIEWALICAFFPLMAVFWGWRATAYVQEPDWLGAVTFAALACGTLFQGVSMLRKPLNPDGTRT